MERWNTQFELELINLLKDWLRQKGKTQKDLRRILNASSDRMPAIIEVLKKEFKSGGLPKLASAICLIEEKWSKNDVPVINTEKTSTPFSQLDLLLEEIQEDCPNK